MRGILFALAHSTATPCASSLVAAGLEGRCRLVTGRSFDAVSGAADAYLLKRALPDWDDERAVAILRNCRRAMSPHARLFVIERIAPEHFCDSPLDQGIARSDLIMLVSIGRRERRKRSTELGAAGL